jgi:hypothetical protein
MSRNNSDRQPQIASNKPHRSRSGSVTCNPFKIQQPVRNLDDGCRRGDYLDADGCEISEVIDWSSLPEDPRV